MTADEELNGTPWVTFSDTFTVDTPDSSTKLRISADDYYTVDVNDVRVGENLTSALGVDSYTLTPAAGVNTIEISVRSDAGPAGLAYRLDTTAPTSIALSATDQTLTFGQATRLTATLQGGTPASNVAIYGQQPERRKVLVAEGQVGADGVLSVRVEPSANTVYTAKYTGETGWAASTSSPLRVSVAGRWAERSLGGYKTKGDYRLYHWTATCQPPNYRGCPFEKYTLAPRHANVKVRMTFQWWNGSRWVSNSYLWRLNKKSSITVVSWYDSREIIGSKHRVRATFLGDKNHAQSSSQWLYWKITR